MGCLCIPHEASAYILILEWEMDGWWSRLDAWLISWRLARSISRPRQAMLFSSLSSVSLERKSAVFADCETLFGWSEIAPAVAKEVSDVCVVVMSVLPLSP